MSGPLTFDQMNIARKRIIERNIKHLQEANAPDEEIYKYLTEGEGITPPVQTAGGGYGILSSIGEGVKNIGRGLQSVEAGGAGMIGSLADVTGEAITKLPHVVREAGMRLVGSHANEQATNPFKDAGEKTTTALEPSNPTTANRIGELVGGAITAPLTGLPAMVAAAIVDPKMSSGNLATMILRAGQDEDHSVLNVLSDGAEKPGNKEKIAKAIDWAMQYPEGRLMIEGVVQGGFMGAHKVLGGIIGKALSKPKGSMTVPLPETSETPITPPAEGSVQAAALAKAQAMTAAGEMKVRQTEINSSERALYKAGAKTEWLKANPGKNGKDWTSLSKAEKTQLHSKFIVSSPDQWQSPEARMLGGLDNQPVVEPQVVPTSVPPDLSPASINTIGPDELAAAARGETSAFKPEEVLTEIQRRKSEVLSRQAETLTDPSTAPDFYPTKLAGLEEMEKSIKPVVEQVQAETVKSVETAQTIAAAQKAVDIAAPAESAPIAKVKGKAGKSTKQPLALRTVDAGKPLGELSIPEIDKLTETLQTSARGERRDADLLDLALVRRKLSREGPPPTSAAEAAVPMVAPVEPAVVPSTEIRTPQLAFEKEQSAMKKLMGVKTNRLTATDQSKLRRWLTEKVQGEDAASVSPQGEGYLAKLHELDVQEKKQEIKAEDVADAANQATDYATWKEHYLANGFKAQLRPGTMGGAAGFYLGYNSGPDAQDNGDRLSRATMWALAGAVGFEGIAAGWANKGKIIPKIDKSPNVPAPIVKNGPKYVSYAADRETTPRSMSDRLAGAYAGTFRRMYGMERLVTRTGGIDRPAQINPSKQAEMYGRAVGRTQGWLSDTPTRIGEDGNLIEYPVYSLEHILDVTAKGDIEGLDLLNVARGTINDASKGRPTHMPVIEAQRIIAGAADHLHEAAEAFRSYGLALYDVERRIGKVTDAQFAKAALEDFWTPMQRVIESAEGREAASAKPQTRINAPEGGSIGKKTGSKLTVQSPYEQMVEMTARVMRMEEYSLLVKTYKDYVDDVFKDNPIMRDKYMQRVSSKNALPQFERAKEALNDLVLTGKLDLKTAELHASMLDEQIAVVGSGDKAQYVISQWENGERRVYQVPKDIFETFKGLTPSEHNWFVNKLSLPTQGLTKAIVANPLFPVRQLFRDTFSQGFTSKYGFVPGLDSGKGLGHIYSRSPEYKDLLRVGAPSNWGTQRFSRTKEALTALKDVGENANQVALKQIKDGGRIGDAMHTYLAPLADAGRVGVYLKALGHGESVLEAAYQAHATTGNTRMEGSNAYVRAINQMIPFARPGLAAMDEMAAKAGVHLFREPTGATKSFDMVARSKAFAGFMAYGLGTVSAFTAALWYANKDDEGINQIRRTTGGSAYWYARVNGEIVKFPKPPFLGHMFGTTTEETLDKMFAKDPQGTESAVGSMFEDAKVNIVPPWLSIPLSLATNHVIGLGTPIVPTAQDNLEPGLMKSEKTSGVAIGLSKILEDATRWAEPTGAFARAVSPAGVEYIMRSLGGYTAQDFMRTADMVSKYQKEGRLPPLTELPLIAGVTSQYPSMNTGSVSEFYQIADKVDKKAKSYNAYIAKQDWKTATKYQQDNKLLIDLTPVYASARDKIAGLRRAITDVRSAPDGTIPPARKRELEKIYVQQINDYAQQVVRFSHQMLKPPEPSSVPAQLPLTGSVRPGG